MADVNWHATPATEALARVRTGAAGISRTEASTRLRELGRNVLPRPEPPSSWAVVARQFREPLVYILGIAGLVSAMIGDFTDASFILLVVGIDVAIGAVQEWRAEQSSMALQRMLRTFTTVLRDGEVQEIDAELLVPGDIVLLEPGNRVPADIRLLTAHGLEVDESPLTGESMPVPKDAGWIGSPAEALADRLNMAHAGTLIVRGRGRGVVVATGDATELGLLAREATMTVAAKPPLQLRMERFTRGVLTVTVAGAVVVAILGIWRGESIAEMVVFGVALAVSVVPEGLPIALTVALAIAARRMARRGVIARRLAAVEGLGSCTYIGSDKTGTLTANELTVRVAVLPDETEVSVTGEGYLPVGEIRIDGEAVGPELRSDLVALLRAAALCNEGELHARSGAWSWRGDPTDVALLVLARKGGVTADKIREEWPLAGYIPFEPDRRFAATWHIHDGEGLYVVKGAPERVLAMSQPNHAHPELMAARERQVEALAADGFRVLALASGTFAGPEPPRRWAAGEPRGLQFLGLVCMLDPLRAGAKEAVAKCRQAGIEVAMITGDHPVTALAIARDLGLASTIEEVVTGADLTQPLLADRSRLVRRARVFARVSPDQKVQIVEWAKTAGHYVAVTGDGVNDAPALRAAHVGIAMGLRGTDVARDAATLVISDDNFSTIVAGVEEGRVAYDNVRKVVFLLVSTGAAEVLLVACAMLAGLPVPLTAAQILWLNLVTNGIQDVALAFEPSEGNALARPPRSPQEPVFDRLMLERTALSATVMGIVTFLEYRHLLASGLAVDQARNAALMLMVLFEIVQIGNARSERQSLLKQAPFGNPLLLGGTAVALSIHFGALYIPTLQAVLSTSPIGLPFLAFLAALSVSVALAMEAHKALLRARDRTGKPASSRSTRA